MDKFLDMLVIIVATIVVLLQTFGFEFVDSTKTGNNFVSYLSRITTFGWIATGSIVIAAVMQIILNNRRYDDDKAKELVQLKREQDHQEREEAHKKHEKEITVKINTLETTLTSVYSSIEKGGYTFDNGIIKPKNIQNIGNGGTGIQNNAGDFLIGGIVSMGHGSTISENIVSQSPYEYNAKALDEILSAIKHLEKQYNISNKFIHIRPIKETLGYLYIPSVFRMLVDKGYIIHGLTERESNDC